MFKHYLKTGLRNMQIKEYMPLSRLALQLALLPAC
jgi:hypothetical protein